MDRAPARWIRSAAELAQLVRELAPCRALAIDTEGDSLHHYTEKVCLIQLAALRGPACLVDPLAVRDLSPLAPLLADPSVLKILHGGDNDITSLRRDFGFALHGLFDTSLAARLLGDAEVGLAALARNELGVEISKGSQRDDWSRRPLTATQEDYALGDVAHLMPLAARLTDRLAAAGRTEWAREEFAALTHLPPARTRTGPDEFRRIKGSARLSRRQQGVLRELYQWREERAAAADRPPFHIVGPEVLLALAERDAATVDDVARALAPYGRQASQVDAVFEAIERGRALPEAELPRRPTNTPPVLPAGAQRRALALREWRAEQAAATRIEPALVLPPRVMDRLAAAGPRTLDDLVAVEGVRRWRVAEWGPALLAACG